MLQAYRIGIIGTIIAVVADQVTKIAAVMYLTAEPIPVLPLFNLRLAWNTGVSFSMFNDLQNGPYVLAAVAFAAFIAFYYMMAKEERKLYKLALGLLAGGALGNGIDRLVHGAVVDFLDFYYNASHFPTFNVADIMINIGVGLLLLDIYAQWKEEKKG